MQWKPTLSHRLGYLFGVIAVTEAFAVAMRLECGDFSTAFGQSERGREA